MELSGVELSTVEFLSEGSLVGARWRSVRTRAQVLLQLFNCLHEGHSTVHSPIINCAFNGLRRFLIIFPVFA